MVVAEPPTTSWIFRPGRYTHDPESGARVAQYDPLPAVEPLDDPRLVTSGYTRSRTVLRGANGTVDTSYRVTNYGNGRGGLDAEWERFHDAWRGSTIAGGAYRGTYGYGYGGYGAGLPPHGGGYGGPPGAAASGPYGYGPAYGYGADYPYAPGYGYESGFGGYAPADRPPMQGPIDPDGANGYDERPRRPFPQRWPWEEQRRRRDLHDRGPERDERGRGGER